MPIWASSWLGECHRLILIGIVNVEVANHNTWSLNIESIFNKIDQQNVVASKLEVSINNCWALFHEIQFNQWSVNIARKPKLCTYVTFHVIWDRIGQTKNSCYKHLSTIISNYLIRKCATKSAVEMNENYIMMSQWFPLWCHSLHVYHNILMLWLGVMLVMFVNNAIILCY